MGGNSPQHLEELIQSDCFVGFQPINISVGPQRSPLSFTMIALEMSRLVGCRW